MKCIALLLVIAFVGCNQSGSSRRISGNGTEAFDARVALDGFGYGSVVFVDALTEGDLEGSEGDLEAGVGVVNAIPFDPVDGFGPPVVIFAQASFDPHVVHDPYDGVRVIWCEDVREVGTGHGEHGHVWSARQTIDGTWQPNVRLDDGLAVRGTLELASDGFGRAIAVWEKDEAIWASFASTGADFGPPVEVARLPGALEVDDPALAVNANGFALLGVMTTLAGGEEVIAVHQADFLHGFGPPERVDTVGFCASPAVEYSRFGTIVVAWQQQLADGSIEVATRRQPLFSGWDPVETIATSSHTHLGNRVALAVDQAGFVTLAFQEDVASFGDGLRVARANDIGPFDVPFSPQASLSGGVPFHQSFDLAVDPLTGCVALVGVPNSDGTPADDPLHEAFGMRFQAGTGAWSLPRDLDDVYSLTPDDSRGIDVAADASGTAIAVWVREGSVRAFVWRTPAADFVALPEPLRAGEAATLDGSSSQAGTDSATISMFEWDLDDDGLFESHGEFVQTTFAAPGSYPVTLRVTDDWGDEAIHARNVLVHTAGSGPLWKLLVLKSGAGSGYVSSDRDSDGDGTPDIDCGDDCEEFYDDGPAPDDHAQVFLTPVADPGSVFSHWEGLDPPLYFDGDYGVEGCLVQMTADRTITAVFE